MRRINRFDSGYSEGNHQKSQENEQVLDPRRSRLLQFEIKNDDGADQISTFRVDETDSNHDVKESQQRCQFF